LSLLRRRGDVVVASATDNQQVACVDLVLLLSEAGDDPCPTETSDRALATLGGSTQSEEDTLEHLARHAVAVVREGDSNAVTPFGNRERYVDAGRVGVDRVLQKLSNERLTPVGVDAKLAGEKFGRNCY